MKTTLKLDMDGKWDSSRAEELEKRVALVSEMTGVPLELEQIWPSHSGGAHVVLSAYRQFQAIPPTEIVLLQCLLGSDLNREAYNYMRARNLECAPAFWQTRWNVHYQEKLPEG